MVTGKEHSWGLRKTGGETSLVAQQLRLDAFNTGGPSSVPGQRAKIPRAARFGLKNAKKERGSLANKAFTPPSTELEVTRPPYSTNRSKEGPSVPSKQNSLMVQWFRVCPPNTEVQVRSLVRELRSRKSHGRAKKKKRPSGIDLAGESKNPACVLRLQEREL